MTSEELWVSRDLHNLSIGLIVYLNDGFLSRTVNEKNCAKRKKKEKLAKLWKLL